MIRHVVLLKWKEDTTDAQVQVVRDGLGTMPDLVPGLLRYEFGSDLGMKDGNADFAIIADFASAADYERYANHPDHLEVIGSAIEPIAASVHRVQYPL